MPLRFKVCRMRNHQGFTLIELMVTISVAAIIMAIAIPSMQTLRANSRVSGVASDLAADLKKSRNAAIVARRNHSFTPVNASVSSNVWGSNGWSLTQVVNGSEIVVFQNKMTSQGVTVNTTATLNNLVFVAATGMIQDNAGDSTTVVFRICDSQSTKETGVDVLINQFGRVLIQKHSDISTCNT